MFFLVQMLYQKQDLNLATHSNPIKRTLLYILINLECVSIKFEFGLFFQFNTSSPSSPQHPPFYTLRCSMGC